MAVVPPNTAAFSSTRTRALPAAAASAAERPAAPDPTTTISTSRSSLCSSIVTPVPPVGRVNLRRDRRAHLPERIMAIDNRLGVARRAIGPTRGETAVITVEHIVRQVDGKRDAFVALADEIWRLAEIRFKEHKSAAAHVAVLEEEGFSVTRNVAGMDTAFVAESGRG